MSVCALMSVLCYVSSKNIANKKSYDAKNGTIRTKPSSKFKNV